MVSESLINKDVERGVDLLSEQLGMFQRESCSIKPIKGYSAFQKFFEDAIEAKIITFCDSPEHIQKTFEEFNLQKLEIIVGDQGKKDYREKLVDKPEIANVLEDLKQQGRLKIYTPKGVVSIHSKIYILRIPNNRVRLLIGSANFSKNAWGRQHEAVAIYETSEGSPMHQSFEDVWEEEMTYCERFLEDLTKEIEKSDQPREEVIRLWVAGKVLSRDVDETRTVTAKLVENLQGVESLKDPVHGLSDARDKREEVIHLRGYDLRTKDQLIQMYEHPEIHFNSHQDILSGPRHAFATRHQIVFGIPIVNVRDHRLVYTHTNGRSDVLSQPWPEDPAEIAKALDHIEQYLSTVDEFADCDDPNSTKMHMYETLLFIFWAPLITPYAQQLDDRGISKDKNLPFLYIHGESGGGKSTFVSFVLRLISRHRVRAPEESRNVSKKSLSGVQQSASAFPFIIDDIEKQKLKNLKDILTGYWSDWRNDSPYPALIFTSNDTKPDEWFRNRSKRLQFDLLYDGRRSYQEKCTALQEQRNDLFSWFSHRYLEVFSRRDASVLDDDVLALGREVFLELYDYAQKPVPKYFPRRPAEDTHDPGLDIWQEHERRGHIQFRFVDDTIVVEFRSSFEYHQVRQLERELHNSIRRQVTGRTITIRNPERFIEWYGETKPSSLWQRLNPFG